MSETRPFYKTRLRSRGQMTLPPEIRDRLQVREGDDVLFRVNEQGQVIVEQVQFIDPEQAWFWSERWQKMEREVQEDIDAGNLLEFDNAEEFIKVLHEAADKEDAENQIQSSVHKSVCEIVCCNPKESGQGHPSFGRKSAPPILADQADSEFQRDLRNPR